MDAPSNPDKNPRGFLSHIIQKAAELGVLDLERLAGSISSDSLILALRGEEQLRADVLEATSGLKAHVSMKVKIPTELALDLIRESLNELTDGSVLVKLIKPERCIELSETPALWQALVDQNFCKGKEENNVRAWLTYVVECGIERRALYELNIAQRLGLSKIINAETLREVDGNAVAEIMVRWLEAIMASPDKIPDKNLDFTFQRAFQLIPPKTFMKRLDVETLWDTIAGLIKSHLGLSPPTEQPPSEGTAEASAPAKVPTAPPPPKGELDDDWTPSMIPTVGHGASADIRIPPPPKSFSAEPADPPSKPAPVSSSSAAQPSSRDEVPQIEVQLMGSVRREGSHGGKTGSGGGSSTTDILKKQRLQPVLDDLGIMIPDRCMDDLTVDQLGRAISIATNCDCGPIDEDLDRLTLALAKVTDYNAPKDKILEAQSQGKVLPPGSLRVYLPVALTRTNPDHMGLKEVCMRLLDKMRGPKTPMFPTEPSTA